MISPWGTRSADASDDRFCERCGSPARPTDSLERRGLRTCPACDLHACGRCWARSAGSCPACGSVLGAMSPVRALGGVGMREPAEPAGARGGPAAAPALARNLPRAPGRARGPAKATGQTPGRWRIALPLGAAAALAIAVMVTATLNRGGPPFRGDVAGIVGTPDADGRGSPPVPGAGSPAGAPGTGSGTPPAAGGGPAPRDAAGQPAGGGSTPGTPEPTRGRTGPPATAKPTPVPAPIETATPAPTPCLRTAPELVGARRNDAASIWADAGFTGEVTAVPGHGNYAIGSQSPAAGAEAPCARGVTIAPVSE